MFRIPTCDVLDAQAPHGEVRQYQFDWKSPAFGGMIGAAHAVEIPFVFQMVNDHRLHVLVGPEAPADLASAMHRAWIDFAVTGAPSLAGADWPAVTADSDTRPVALFDDQISVADDPQGSTRRWWATRRG